jgi:diguanylate cyclase (GGDEF)-like protein
MSPESSGDENLATFYDNLSAGQMGEGNPLAGVELSDGDRESLDKLSGAYFVRLEREAPRDSLTGLYAYHKKETQNLIEDRLKFAGRNGNGVVLAEFDGDSFKEVNDKYGHEVGDQVIKCLASAIAQSCRAGDIATRFGGEEFGLILVNGLDIAVVRDVIDRVSEAYSRNLQELAGREAEFSKSKELSFAKLSQELTFSVGVSQARTIKDHGINPHTGRHDVEYEDITSLRLRSDLQLYRAKGDEEKLKSMYELADQYFKSGQYENAKKILEKILEELQSGMVKSTKQ